MSKTAEELARTLRWCADSGQIKGLHPAAVREAADRLIELDKKCREQAEILASNEHTAKVEVISDGHPYQKEVRVLLSIASPRMYWSSIIMDEMRLADEKYRLDYMPRLLVHQCTKAWLEELTAKVSHALKDAPMPEPREIAAGLSPAQKFWLRSARRPSGMGKWPVQNALIDKGLAKAYPWHLTPLGLAVRAVLEGE